MKPFLLFTLLLAWKGNAIICISQANAKGSNLSDCWVFRQKFSLCIVLEAALILPVTNFSLFPNVPVDYDQPL